MERPILFSGPMVRAILDGSKMQTRRVIRFEDGFSPDRLIYRSTVDGAFTIQEDVTGRFVQLQCPYGKEGDRLWVRETFAVQPFLWEKNHGLQPVHYPASVPRDQIEDYVLKPSIHMPRWASRITLEITGVRVERVQAISEADAEAEGAMEWWNSKSVDEQASIYNGKRGPRAAFEMLWDSINAKRGYGWDANPWVWALEFRRVQ